MPSARESILALICGYPAEVRERLLLALFVSYVDESGNGGPIFTVGGLTATPDAWLGFSDEWQKNVLDPPPKIPFFKFNNEHQLSKDSHAKKIVAGINAINRHLHRADCLIVDVGEYEVYLKGLIGVTQDNPIHASYLNIISQCALGLAKTEGQIDYVFDDMDDTQYLELLHAFRRFREICPDEKVKQRLVREPVRGDDKRLLPLQASDLWSGLFRASAVDADALELLRKIEIPNRGILWDQDHFAQLLSRQVQRFPEITTGKYYEDRRARSKRLKDDRKRLKGITSSDDQTPS